MSLRVLLATPYDLNVPGGVNRHVLGLLDALTARGVDARLVGPASADVLGHDPRVTVVGRVSTIPFNGAASRVPVDPRLLLPLRRLVRDFAPDVVHVQEPVSPLPSAALLWLAPRNALRVGTFHTYSETSRGYLWAWPWAQAVWSRLHARVAVSEPAREFATRYHRAAFEIIPNAIALPASPAPLRETAGPVSVLFLGRLDEPRKGFGVLVRALRRIEAEAPGLLTVTAIGRGAEGWRGETSGLPVSFGGEVTEPGLARVFEAADLVAVPSMGGESFGLVPLEAMAYRRPVVASGIFGYAWWMEGAARLVPPGDDAALAAALRELAGSPAQRADLSARGAEVARRYSWDVVVERWLALYQSAARGAAT